MPVRSPPDESAPERRVWRFFRSLITPEQGLRIALAAGGTLVLGAVLRQVASPGPEVGSAVLWLSIVLGSLHGLPAAWKAIRSLRPDIDLLMVIGAYTATVIGHPEEGALLLFMFTLAGALESRALARARDAVSRLSRLMPRNASRHGPHGWEEVDPDRLEAQDRILVRPGDTVPADAVVLLGRSHIDQSTITGESLPRAVGPGDSLFAGTTNQDGALEASVVRPARDSSIQRILALVLEAQERRQPVQRVIDRIATPYAMTVIATSMALAPLLVLLGDLTWSAACYRAITLLVVCSPCALVIATPTATLSGLSRAARAGVLLKGGDALERLSRVGTIATDKTGTLTTGRIEVTSVEPLGGADSDRLLGAALAAEERSTHPIAAAVVALARGRGLTPAHVESVSNVPGRGVEARRGGALLRIGTLDFCASEIATPVRRQAAEHVERLRQEGGMPIVVASEGRALVLGLSDRPRTASLHLVEDLRRVGVHRVVMLTGDHRQTAERMARQLGIAEFHAELLPEQKVETLERLRRENERLGAGGSLGVIGDGVNDAPVLATADVGLAMGTIGSDAALESADVVLLNDDISRVPWAIGLARHARRIMIANLAFALLVIAVLAVATLLGQMPLALGVLGHEGSTLLVVANSLRLLGYPDRKFRGSTGELERLAHRAASEEPSEQDVAAITASGGAGASRP